MTRHSSPLVRSFVAPRSDDDEVEDFGPIGPLLLNKTAPQIKPYDHGDKAEFFRSIPGNSGVLASSEPHSAGTSSPSCADDVNVLRDQGPVLARINSHAQRIEVQVQESGEVHMAGGILAIGSTGSTANVTGSSARALAFMPEQGIAAAMYIQGGEGRLSMARNRVHPASPSPGPASSSLPLPIPPSSPIVAEDDAAARKRRRDSLDAVPSAEPEPRAMAPMPRRSGRPSKGAAVPAPPAPTVDNSRPPRKKAKESKPAAKQADEAVPLAPATRARTATSRASAATASATTRTRGSSSRAPAKAAVAAAPSRRGGSSRAPRAQAASAPVPRRGAKQDDAPEEDTSVSARHSVPHAAALTVSAPLYGITPATSEDFINAGVTIASLQTTALANCSTFLLGDGKVLGATWARLLGHVVTLNAHSHTPTASGREVSAYSAAVDLRPKTITAFNGARRKLTHGVFDDFSGLPAIEFANWWHKIAGSVCHTDYSHGYPRCGEVLVAADLRPLLWRGHNGFDTVVVGLLLWILGHKRTNINKKSPSFTGTVAADGLVDAWRAAVANVEAVGALMVAGLAG
jgi:hypothetical protein